MKQQPTLPNRLSSMICDHIFMSFIIGLISVPVLMYYMGQLFESEAGANASLFSGPFYVLLGGMAIYLCKDAFRGQSIAKRLFKLQVIDVRSGRAAGPIQCMARNIFIIVWPLEVIMVLIKPSRRLGDYVAGTEVTVIDPTQEKAPLNAGRTVLSLVLAFLFLYLLCLPFKLLLSQFEQGSPLYSEKNRNDSLSTRVNALLIDSLHQELNPELKIYNKPGDTNIVFISGSLHLHQDYANDDAAFEALHQKTNTLIRKVLHKKVKGNLKFVYKTSFKYSTRTRYIDSDSDEPQTGH